MRVPMQEGRLYLVFTPAADGAVEVKVTSLQPVNPNAAMVVLRSRGLSDEDRTFLIAGAARKGDPGKDATPEQIANAVAAYLIAHPPAAGRAPTSAEIAAAVAAYQAANPVATLTKVEFAVSLVDAYAAGLSAGGDSKRIACAGVRMTDALSVQPTAALPSGYMIGSVACTENGWVRVGFVRPLLALGANNTIRSRSQPSVQAYP